MLASHRHLRCYFPVFALPGLGPFESGPMEAIREAGYEGVQFKDPINGAELDQALTLGLGACGSGTALTTEAIVRIASDARLAGLECVTLSLGNGLEEDDIAVRLVEGVLNASAKHSIPLYVETRSASLFQDMWRAVSFHRRFPALEFNGDFSHWYTGQQMAHGNFEQKLTFVKPMLGCVRFLHGRISDPGSIQVDLGSGDIDGHPNIAHFRTLWKHVFDGFLTAENTKQPFITFAPELLPPHRFYARTFHGKEESDRWQQSLLLCKIAKECFHEKLSELGRPSAESVKRARRSA